MIHARKLVPLLILAYSVVQIDALSTTPIPQCALQCVSQAVSQAGGSNYKCMDPDATKELISCISPICNAQETKTFLERRKQLCEAPLTDHRQSIRIIVTLFAIIATVFIILRVSSRFILKTPWGSDDTSSLMTFLTLIPFTVFTILAIKAGVGMSAPLFNPKTISHLFRVLYTCPLLMSNDAKKSKWTFIVHIHYIIGVALAKISILFFYMRIFPDYKFTILVWVTMAFIGVSSITLITLTFTVGRAVTLCLNVKEDFLFTADKYFSLNVIILVYCALNCVLDIWLLALPMPQLYGMGLKRRKKIRVMAMFSLGAFLLRTIMQAQILLPSQGAVDAGQQWIVLCACVENYVGCIVTCIPAARQLLSRLLSRHSGDPQSKTPVFVVRSLAEITDDETS
ncbi:uncharacterized protein FMAN_05259 [Fusarium mangiferae]|uniref:Uncharacterized protein n=1 Tax=Fusarium mangiferae TaxID=192010 RepID=A0A1L7SXD8_FUSMA|nr:uncharacterized protein FMAN_05259 [Fusarium mangiferae]CVK87955.1 uncharacterized protein FMAN_05259 [Fusarium mangiferae]